MIVSISGKTNKQQHLVDALANFRAIVSQRIGAHFSQADFNVTDWIEGNIKQDLVPAPMSKHLPMLQTPEEWMILMLALTPHLQPNFFESIILEHLNGGGDFPEFGGVRAQNHRGMLPTGETAQFIIAGNDLQKRLSIHQYFSEDHFFFRQTILWLEPLKEGEPVMSGRIVMAQDWIDKLLFDKETLPKFGLDFPAKRITTSMHWEDAVLHPHTLTQVNDIAVWLQHHEMLHQDDNLGRKIKPGYRVLFYGPSGTGKTLTASLLGKQFQRDVYRIDLSQIVSKYIGETEKNLESVFRRAESKNWILFFDEADALFGKRTNVQSSHDKYANQEVSYLLQRVEDYPGLLILASNYRNNIDDAFIRRFHSVVHFPMPNANERMAIWQKSMPAGLKLHESIKLDALAKQYEMSGAAILNAVQFAMLQAYARKDGMLHHTDLVEGVRKEYLKEEKSI